MQTQLLCFGIVVFTAIPKGHGVEAEVAVDMLLVEVGGDDDLKAVTPHLLCQLHANLVRNRVSHKFSFYPERYDGFFSCVGCGRCLARCPIQMNIVKVMKTLGGKQNG